MDILSVSLLALGTLAGAGLSLLYFGGLWWTVCRMTGSHTPYRLGLFSFFLRSTIALAGFYLLLLWHGYALAGGMLGFLGMRTLLIRRWGFRIRELDVTEEESQWS